MLAGLLEILSILGILLLLLLGLLLLVILLVLFLPVAYRIDGWKKFAEFSVCIKIRWLMGIFRMDYCYPEPGAVVAKAFGFRIYDSSRTAEKEQESGTSSKPPKSAGAGKRKKKKRMKSKKEPESTDKDGIQWDKLDSVELSEKEEISEEDELSGKDIGYEEMADNSRETQEHKNFFDKILVKFEKIKYTFRKICDKIKDILKNIVYYKNLFQDEETKQLFGSLLRQAGKIWKAVRPRKIIGHIRFGTGSPDTTGYALAFYGMISPFLGNDIFVTPDFEGTVLEGDVAVSGHITVFVLLVNGLKIAFDSQLRLFLRKLKREEM